jgi:hypothetical protein
MKRILEFKAAIVVAALASAPAAQATTMLGNTLTFERLYPDLSTTYLGPFTPPTTIAAAGPGDAVQWIANNIVYATIDPDANGLTFSLIGTYIGTGGVFDGYRISGFSQDILAVTPDPNYTGGLTITPAFGNGPGARYITVNLAGNANPPFTLGVEFAPSTGHNGVPEPRSGGLVLGALAALAFVSRRVRRR